MTPRGVFITATGTDSGKTFVTRGLARALTQHVQSVAALKPIETGCAPDPLDAIALATACGHPELAHDPDFYRAAPPLAPYAASLEHGTPAPDLDRLARRILTLAIQHDLTLVEGAGGLLVPIDAAQTLADLAERLGFPILLVAPNRLGVLSHVLTAYESAIARRLEIAAVILTEPDPTPADPSQATNAQILATKLPIPIRRFPHTPNDNEALAQTATASGLTTDLLSQ